MSDKDDDKHEEVRYLWWDGVTVQALRERLNAAGPDAILKLNGPFNAQATLEVLDPSQDAATRLAPLNESHVCPPACLI